jgi:hypothetical protein
VSPRRSFLPRLEILEDRNLLSTFMVLNLGDAGLGSLRQAILDANNHSGADVIRFAPQVRGTIAPGSDGGMALGGGIANGLGTLVVRRTTLIGNEAIGGAGGAGANGGIALGGGLYNLGDATLTKSTITRNKARGGAAGSGGLAGLGIGGGVYNDVDWEATIWIDARTWIFANYADLFPDLYGFQGRRNALRDFRHAGGRPMGP